MEKSVIPVHGGEAVFKNVNGEDLISPFENNDPQVIESGKFLYFTYCAQCHGAGGKGDGINATEEMPVSPRNHTSSQEMAKLTSEDVYFAIKDGGKSVGKSSLMPRWGATIDDGEIKELVTYLTTLCKCKYKAK